MLLLVSFWLGLRLENVFIFLFRYCKHTLQQPRFKGVSSSHKRQWSKFTIPSTDPPKKFFVERLFLVAVLKLVIFPVSLTLVLRLSSRNFSRWTSQATLAIDEENYVVSENISHPAAPRPLRWLATKLFFVANQKRAIQTLLELVR
mgnify:CR=1 FL=1